MDRADRQTGVLVGRQRRARIHACFLEEADERRLMAVAVLVAVRRAAQRPQVLLDARAVRRDVSILGALQQPVVAVDRSAGDRQRADHRLGDRRAPQQLTANVGELLAKQRKRGSRGRSERVEIPASRYLTGRCARLDQVDLGLPRVLNDYTLGRRSDTAGRCPAFRLGELAAVARSADGASKRERVVRVGDERDVCQRVEDLDAFPQRVRTDHAIRDPGRCQRVLQRLGVAQRAAQHEDLPRIGPARNCLANPAGQNGGLLMIGGEPRDGHLAAGGLDGQ